MHLAVWHKSYAPSLDKEEMASRLADLKAAHAAIAKAAAAVQVWAGPRVVQYITLYCLLGLAGGSVCWHDAASAGDGVRVRGRCSTACAQAWGEGWDYEDVHGLAEHKVRAGLSFWLPSPSLALHALPCAASLGAGAGCG